MIFQKFCVSKEKSVCNARIDSKLTKIVQWHQKSTEKQACYSPEFPHVISNHNEPNNWVLMWDTRVWFEWYHSSEQGKGLSANLEYQASIQLHIATYALCVFVRIIGLFNCVVGLQIASM